MASIKKPFSCLMNTAEPCFGCFAYRLAGTNDDVCKRAEQCTFIERMIYDSNPKEIWSPKGSFV